MKIATKTIPSRKKQHMANITNYKTDFLQKYKPWRHSNMLHHLQELQNIDAACVYISHHLHQVPGGMATESIVGPLKQIYCS